MLGLGLALSVGRKLLGDAIGRLIQKLSIRGTYSENLIDTRNIITDIDDADVLDKATILLTPTATSNARVHSVKTYTGENFLTGNNSTFDSGIGDWGVYSGASVAHSTDKLEVTLTSSEGGVNIDTNALISGGQTGKTLKVRARIWQGTWTGTFLRMFVGGVQESIYISSTPTYYEVIIKPTGTSNLTIYRSGTGSTGTFFIDDVSVVDVSSDFDFDRASSATRINSSGLVQDMQSITDPELVLNGDFEELGDEEVTNGDFSNGSTDWSFGTGITVENNKAFFNDSAYPQAIEQTNVATVGKQYKVSFTVSDYQSGTVKLRHPFEVSGIQADGDYVFYGEAATTGITLRGDGVPNNFKIDNISVKQVDPNDRWSLSGATTFEDGVLHFESNTNEYSYARQDINSLAANTYEIQLEIKNYVSGACQVGFSGTSPNIVNLNVTSDGTYTANLSPNTNGDDLEISRNFSGGNFNFDVEVVSVKDITFSTEVDLARINYDSNGENGHILLEPTSTNLVTYSEDFSQWTADDVEVVNNATTSPNGDVTATLIKGNTNTSRHHVANTALTNTVTASFSVFAKAKELRYLQIASANSTDQVANFDLLNGTVGTIGAGFSDVVLEEYPNDWYRISLVSLNRYNSFYISLVSSTTASWLESWTMPNSTDGLYIWGAQLEELSYATSYIPTLTGSTVTRAAETLTGSGNSTLINSTEGVLYAEIAALANDATNRSIALSDGTTDDRVTMLFGTSSNRIRAIIKSNNSTSFDEEYTVTSTLDYHKVAIKYKANDFALWIDGVERFTDTSGSAPIGLNQLVFNVAHGTLPFYGKCKALAVFDEALSDTELENLTS